MRFEPVPVQRPREQVEMQLRAAILDRSFPDGDKLPSELELASRFKVSRTTIREALRSLASQGLVRKVPGAAGGSFVNAIDHISLAGQVKDGVSTVLSVGSLSLSEILLVRDLLEVPAAALAAEQITPAQLDVLRECLEQAGTADLDDTRLATLDVRFHSVIAEASGNRLLSAFVGALQEATRPTDLLSYSEADNKEKHHQHLAILQAITDGDAARAESAMQDHIDFLRQVDENPRRVSNRSAQQV